MDGGTKRTPVGPCACLSTAGLMILLLLSGVHADQVSIATQYIYISNSIHYVNLMEVTAYNSHGDTIKASSAEFSDGHYEGFPASNCIDGDASTMCHSSAGSASLEIDLGGYYDVSTVIIQNRVDWCSECSERAKGSIVGMYSGSRATGALAYSWTINDASSKYTLRTGEPTPMPPPTATQTPPPIATEMPPPTPQQPSVQPGTHTTVLTFAELSACATTNSTICVVNTNIDISSTISISGVTSTIMSTNSAALSGLGTTQLFDVRSSGTQVSLSVCLPFPTHESLNSTPGSFPGDLFGADAQEWVSQHWWLCLCFQQCRCDLHQQHV